MATVNTNIPPTKSFGTDWSTVWSTLQGTDYVITKRLWLGVIILSVAYIVGCILHATGNGMINIVICTIAMLTVFVNAARPVMLTIFGLGGAIYAWTDKDVDTGPGIKAGLMNLGRLANAVMLFIGLTFFLLGTWPLAVPTWMYAILPAGTALIVNILIYEKMASKGWVWLLGGSYVITILLYGAFSEVPIVKAVVGWADAKQEGAAKAINESAANSGSTPQPAPEKAVAWKPTLGDFDPIIVPAGSLSETIDGFDGTTVCWARGLPDTVIREVRLLDNTYIDMRTYDETKHGLVTGWRWYNTGHEAVTVRAWRKSGRGCGN